ncbi:hypothetical protein NM688_g8320 [Phlebia brevispora]|uniref:Uncharacterized protein n=1 Tax=Phlebia brevispora TaxID=194682 RepID=A0ACC1RUG6_9APHY|nr:hypothetical protein NM688_g8320 [Phlebia brevispora]
MARHRTNLENSSTSSNATKRGSHWRNQDASTADIHILKGQHDTAKQGFLLAKNTTKTYAGHIRRGKMFLMCLKNNRIISNISDEAGQQLSAQLESEEDINYDKLVIAFDEPPNHYSPYTLELFLAEKCLQQGCKGSLCDQIHAAFKDYWKKMADGRYRGPWSSDPETGKVSGNPADSPQVEELMRTIKNKMRAAGVIRDHAEAMKIEHLRKMMDWSYEQCSQQAVDAAFERVRNCCDYRIFSNPKLPEIDMHYHLRLWWSWLERALLHHPLQAEDHVFLTISINGQVQITTHVSNTVVQSWLDEAILGVRLSVAYTTHSFGRSGAQYQFMWCPLGQWWSLSAVRWWGGWADGERSDTLVKYLIDELNECESSHADALCPLCTELDTSFMGEHARVSQVSSKEVREATMAMKRELQSAMNTIRLLCANNVLAIQQGLSSSATAPYSSQEPSVLHVFDDEVSIPSYVPNYNPMHPSVLAFSNTQDHLHSISSVPSTLSTSPSATRWPVHGTAVAYAPTGLTGHITHGDFHPSVQHHLLPLPMYTARQQSTHMPLVPTVHVPQVQAPPFPPRVILIPPQTASQQARSTAHTQSEDSRDPRKVQPVKEAIILNLPRSAAAWHEAVRQWTHIDPSTGRALKDWPKEWYRGEMCLFNGMKYQNRQMVAEEYFNRFNKNDATFIAAYPEAEIGWAALIEAIR